MHPDVLDGLFLPEEDIEAPKRIELATLQTWCMSPRVADYRKRIAAVHETETGDSTERCSYLLL